MNKKLVYLFAVLVVGLFVISACDLIKQEDVGMKINKNELDNKDRYTIFGVRHVAIDCGKCTDNRGRSHKCSFSYSEVLGGGDCLTTEDCESGCEGGSVVVSG